MGDEPSPRLTQTLNDKDLGTSKLKESLIAPTHSKRLSFPARTWGYVAALLFAGDGELTWAIADQLLQQKPEQFAEFRATLQLTKGYIFPEKCPDKFSLRHAIEISAACGEDIMTLLDACGTKTAVELLSDLRQRASENLDSKLSGESLLFDKEQRGLFYCTIVERFDTLKQIFKETYNHNLQSQDSGIAN